MSDIDDLQRRLAAAMDRIGQGVATLADKSDAAGKTTQALEDMRKTLDDLRKTNASLQTRLSDLSQESVRLREANTDLRETIQALREAGEDKLGDPAKIDTAMAAELESLRAVQATSEAEARAILDALAPLLAETKVSA